MNFKIFNMVTMQSLRQYHLLPCRIGTRYTVDICTVGFIKILHLIMITFGFCTSSWYSPFPKKPKAYHPMLYGRGKPSTKEKCTLRLNKGLLSTYDHTIAFSLYHRSVVIWSQRCSGRPSISRNCLNCITSGLYCNQCSSHQFLY